MRKLLGTVVGRHSVLSVLAVLGIIDLLLVANAILPDTMKFILDRHIFEVVVLSALGQLLLLMSAFLWRLTPTVIGSEEEAQERVRELLDSEKSIRSVKVLSAGMRSRASFLRGLLEMPRGLQLEIVACFGGDGPNPDALDRETLGPSHFKVITHRLEGDAASRLKIWVSHNTPSFRCLLLCDSHQPRYAFVSWYVYRKGNTEIVGRRNVQVLVDGTTEAGNALLRFAERTYESYATDDESSLLFPPPEDIPSEN